MGRLSVTSPGVLLILAVVLAGAVFVLDAFYLKPHVTAQEWDTLRQQASRVQQTTGRDLREYQTLLEGMCATSAQGLRLRQLGTAGLPGAFAPLAQSLFGEADVDMAWVADPDRRVIDCWRSARKTPLSPAAAQKIQAALGTPRPGAEMPRSGIVRAEGNVVFFARRHVPRLDKPATPAGDLWIVRAMDASFLKAARHGEYLDLVFVPDAALPEVRDGQQTADCRLWHGKPDELSVAWVLYDPAGKPLGYLRADLDVKQIHLQAIAGRRMTLITLSLSAGAVLIVILATQILIAGPVFRLLRRLQTIDSGGQVADLTKDLHGEPLMLARRLESAFGKLAHMSQTDELTGLANRRHFLEVLRAFYHQARRYSRPLSLIQLDVDFFKAVNDACGHQGGDLLIKAVADEINRACRQADLPARLGGDEFVVLLPETSSTDAAAVAERIRSSVSAGGARINGVEMKVTVSIGIADLNAGEIATPEEMLALADRAMYAAKELGRDRIVQAHDLGGVTWKGEPGGQRVDTLHRKLAGLDGEFKGLFLKAIQEVVEVLEQRDPYMVAHALKVKETATLIARRMELPERVVKRVEIAGMLHDIGMLVLPDSVLQCPGELDEQQWQAMRRHPLLSVRIMEGMEFLEQEIPAVRYHHERYDGKGYPEGIAGASIPLTARILAVAEAFVGMTSPRSFRGAHTLAEATAQMAAASGTQFDPAVVDAILALADTCGPQLLCPPKTSPQAACLQVADAVATA